MSDILKINTSSIGIKSKTNDGICAIGHGKAIAAISNCLLMEQL
jgi:2C-methyl-D-erythritol 2,4-cyclodiphosphate synthase